MKSIPSDSALLLISEGVLAASSLISTTVPLIGVNTSEAAFTLSTAPTVST